MTKKTKIIVTIALMLGMALAALDTTIVVTALPSIVGKLGGITLYSWVFSAYLLTSTSTVAIYGKHKGYSNNDLRLFGHRGPWLSHAKYVGKNHTINETQHEE